MRVIYYDFNHSKMGEGRVQPTWHDVDEMPADMEKVTSVHVFCG